LLPELPSNDLKIGKFIRQAMRNLSKSGYVFSADTIERMLTKEWSLEVFHTEKPFMKRYIEGVTDTRGPEGKYVRFWSEVFTFGTEQVYISKEWYEGQRKRFIDWYESLSIEM